MNKIKCWTGKCGALVVNELPNGIVSPKLSKESAKFYGGDYLIFESASDSTMRTTARALGLEFVEHIPTSKAKFLGAKEVAEVLQVKKEAVYLAVKRNELPKPIQLGVRLSRWLESEVTAIINARIAGKSSTEIKALVIQLEAQRLNACEVNA